MKHVKAKLDFVDSDENEEMGDEDDEGFIKRSNLDRMSTPQDPILAGAMEGHMPRGDYWAGLYNAKSTRHVRPQAGRARLSAHGRARG